MREVAGLVFVVVALAIAPLGYYWSAVWWTIAVALLIVGVLLFYSERVHRREQKHRASAPAENAFDTIDNHSQSPLPRGRLRSRSLDTDDSATDSDGD